MSIRRLTLILQLPNINKAFGDLLPHETVGLRDPSDVFHINLQDAREFPDLRSRVLKIEPKAYHKILVSTIIPSYLFYIFLNIMDISTQ